MKALPITTPSKDYTIYVGENIFPLILDFFRNPKYQQVKLLIITDTIVEKLYLEKLLEKLKPLNTKVFVKTVAAGEESKSIDTYYQCLTACIEHNLTRQDILIAFGGGVVGDLTGFVAATYMRGIRFLQIPTTLLAHDSSVGGKVAINHELGKNLIGSFYQPEAVFYHLPFLNSLPKNQWRSGFAEVIKESLISTDVSLFELLIKDITCQKDICTKVNNYIVRGMNIKATIVSEDEREQGKRAVLNFGHTLGHALEKTCLISHGDAVAIGMVFAIYLSIDFLKLQFDIVFFQTWLKKLGYLKLPIDAKITSEKLIGFMHNDKKNKSEKIGFVLLKNLGEPTVCQLEKSYVEKNLEIFLKDLFFKN